MRAAIPRLVVIAIALLALAIVLGRHGEDQTLRPPLPRNEQVSPGQDDGRGAQESPAILNRSLARQSQDDTLMVQGSLERTGGHPASGLPYSVIEGAQGVDSSSIVDVLDQTTAPVTSDRGEWSVAIPSDSSDALLWFKVRKGTYVAFRVPTDDATLLLVESEITVDVPDLLPEEVAYIYLYPGDYEDGGIWRPRQSLLVETGRPHPEHVLNLITDRQERTIQGPSREVFRTVAGVSYRVLFRCNTRQPVDPEILTSPTQWFIGVTPLSRTVEGVVLAGNGEESSMGGWFGFCVNGEYDLMSPFTLGKFRPPVASVVNTKNGATATATVVLDSGELISREFAVEGERIVVQFVEGTGVLPVTISKASVPQGGDRSTELLVWKNGDVLRGTDLRHASACHVVSAIEVYVQETDTEFRVHGLPRAWNQIWMRASDGEASLLMKGESKATVVEVGPEEPFDWQGIARRYGHGDRLVVALEYQLWPDANWTSWSRWDLHEDPSPSIRPLQGVPFRVTLGYQAGPRVVLR